MIKSSYKFLIINKQFLFMPMSLKLKGCVYTHTEIQIPKTFSGKTGLAKTGTHT